MKTGSIVSEDLRGVFAVPPMPRNPDARRSPNLEETGKLIRHILAGGITRFLWGGNAFFYHISLADYETLLDAVKEHDGWQIPGVGPSFGRALDQARILRKHSFPCAMVLPSGDPRNARGLEQGMMEIAEAAGMPLILYLKAEENWGTDKEAGLDAVARLVKKKICIAIKYAVVRKDPAKDAYLDGLLKRVDRSFVVSGIGERPAVVHLRDFKLPGFTTGSGCVAPRLTQSLFEACRAGDFAAAEKIRESFLPHEDLRDAWGPAPVLHAAVEGAGIAKTGPILPYLAPLTEEQIGKLGPVARKLAEENARAISRRP